MKQFQIIFLTGLLVMTFATPLLAKEEVKLVASNYSDRYHVTTCKVAKKIPLEESLFFKTPEEALAKNLVPCKKCYPPTSSIESD